MLQRRARVSRLLSESFGGKAARGTWSCGIMSTSVKWAAELAHVREVSLLGTADLAFWKDRLLKEEHSEVLQITTTSDWRGRHGAPF